MWLPAFICKRSRWECLNLSDTPSLTNFQRPALKVTHLNTLATGGAANAAIRLHQGQLVAGMDSLFVRAKPGRVQEGVHELSSMRAAADLVVKCKRKIRRWSTARWLGGRRPGTYLSDPLTAYAPEDLEGIRRPDVFNLHWMAEFLDWESMLPWMAARAPVVWTLHDMNPFVGIWHYLPNEDDWTDGLRKWDRQARLIKQRVLDSLPEGRLTVVGPSRWICDEARSSSLMRRFDVRHIPYGVDTEVFHPIDKKMARQALGLNPDMSLIGFAADYLLDSRKGGTAMSEALRLANTPGLFSLVVGSAPASYQLPPRTVHLGRLDSSRLMALFYSALDVFVCPSLQDNLPNTVLEALACGTPVVGFDTGGIPDMVRPGITGWLVAASSVAGLAQALDNAFSAPDRLESMRVRCREVALCEYALSVQAVRYGRLYNELI